MGGLIKKPFKYKKYVSVKPLFSPGFLKVVGYFWRLLNDIHC